MARARGEVWWARLDEVRLVVLLSGDGARDLRAIVVVPPATTDLRGAAIELALGAEEGLSEEGVLRVAIPQDDRALCNWVVTLGEGDLVQRVGMLSPGKLGELGEILRRGGLE
jgi:mRNA interferase MazF